jgi:hypothetical protein
VSLPTQAAVLASVHALLASLLLATNAKAQSNCEDISAVPAFTQINFQLNISSLFTNNCASCHISGGASGGLNLDFANAYANLVGMNSSQNAAFVRVQPGNPAASLLFQKVNCDSPGVGSRMPLGGSILSPAQQRILSDWIALGAPLMRGGFENR